MSSLVFSWTSHWHHCSEFHHHCVNCVEWLHASTIVYLWLNCLCAITRKWSKDFVKSMKMTNELKSHYFCIVVFSHWAEIDVTSYFQRFLLGFKRTMHTYIKAWKLYVTPKLWCAGKPFCHLDKTSPNFSSQWFLHVAHHFVDLVAIACVHRWKQQFVRESKR